MLYHILMMGLAKPIRSTSTPITLGIISIVLTLALIVGWILIVLQSANLSQQWTANIWYLVLGLISFLTILTMVALLSLFLVREINEGKRQRYFIDSVTHELKIPIASMRLCLETLTRQDLPEQKRGELQSMMLQELERLGHFIDDILSASRMRNILDTDGDNPVAIEPLTYRICRLVESHHGLPQGTIALHIQATTVRTSQRLLETILRNLIDNAVKYSQPNPKVAVEATLSNDKVEFRVKDFGIGIPRLQLSRIFDRFYRVSSETVRSRRGTGLGLFVAAGLSKQLGGTLHAESAGENQGTTMTLSLPHKTHPKQQSTSHALNTPRIDL